MFLDSIFGIDITGDGEADFLDDAIIFNEIEAEEAAEQERREADDLLWFEDEDI